MYNYKLVYVTILCLALLSLFSLGCDKDKSPTNPEPEPEKPWTSTDVVYTPARVWADTLAKRGYVVMTIDYLDFNEGARYPQPVPSFKIAVEYLRRNAAQYGITTGKIVGFGQQSGASTWAVSITWDNDDNFFHTDPTISDKLDAAILLYGIYDPVNFMSGGVNNNFTTYYSTNPDARATKGNPIANVSNIDTPVLLLHGTESIYSLPEQSIQFNDSLVAHGKSSHLILFPGETDFFDYGLNGSLTPAGLVAKDSVLAYLERTLF